MILKVTNVKAPLDGSSSTLTINTDDGVICTVKQDETKGFIITCGTKDEAEKYFKSKSIMTGLTEEA